MAIYAAITYTRDVDWSAPEQAEEMVEYKQFGDDHQAQIRGGAALYPTGTATVVRVKGARGGDVVTTDGPYAETKEALTGFYLLEAAPGRGDQDRCRASGRMGRRGRSAAGHPLGLTGQWRRRTGSPR